MNRPIKHPPIVAAFVSPAGAAATSIGADGSPKRDLATRQTGEAVAPNLSTDSGWGKQPICPGCHRGSITSCLCDPFYEDTPEPTWEEFVAPFELAAGWHRVRL